MKNNWKKIEEVLGGDGVAVAPTDTIYGILGRAFSRHTVERIFKIKGRDENKPLIILITKFSDLENFGIILDQKGQNFLQKFWPGRLTVILPSVDKKILKKLKYLHRGRENFAIRMIGKRNRNLYNLINKTGPLVAPSANPQDLPPANTIAEAKRYFEDKIDVYIDGGKKTGKSSTIISYLNNKFKIIRQGDVIISS